MNSNDLKVDAAESVERQATAAGKALAGMVTQMIDDGVQPAALTEALAEVLGSVVAFAPRGLADKVLEGAIDRARISCAAAWVEIDEAASATH